MSKTLIAYGTRYGATAEVASEIANVLKNHSGLDVQVVDLNRQNVKDSSNFENIVVGSGIKMGKWNSAAKKFLKRGFNGKKVAVFVCSRRAGEPETYDYALNRYVSDILRKYHVTAIASEAFGGRKPLKDGTFYENRDWEKIKKWAKKLRELFAE